MTTIDARQALALAIAAVRALLNKPCLDTRHDDRWCPTCIDREDTVYEAIEEIERLKAAEDTE